MRIFMTGATGFIGAALAARLNQGHQVTALVRPGSNTEKLPGAVALARYDGSLESLVDAIDAAQPDVAIHVASLFLAQHRPEDVARLAAANIDMPLKLLEAMRICGARLLLNTGTSWQHYRDAAYDPVNLYAATKQAFESLLAYYVAAHGFRAHTLKLFDTYGPGDARPKLFSLLRRAAQSGERLQMSPGEQMMDLVYIDDVVEAFVRALPALDDGPATFSYAVNAERRLSLREVAATFGEAVGRPLNIEWGGLGYRPRETLIPWSSGVRPPLWTPKVGLAEGIARMERDPTIGGLMAAA